MELAGVAGVDPTTLPDEQLIRRVADRDTEAGSILFDRYAGEIHRYFMSRLGPDESEDLLQETFARALRGACRFRGDAAVRTWLRAIARHTLSERLRGPGPAITLTELCESRSGPESLAIRREEVAAKLASLARLPEEQATVLELHRIEGLSHVEIAKLLGIKPATSRKRLERALQALESRPPTAGAPTRPPGRKRRSALRPSLRRRFKREENQVD